MSLRSAVEDLVAALTAAGISAAADPGELNLPGVWVQLESVAHTLLSGGVTVRLRLYCVAGDTGTLNALDQLSPLYEAVCGVVTPNTDTDTTTVGVQLPDNPTTPMPSLQLSVDVLDNLTT
jgi:hypothetical protein